MSSLSRLLGTAPPAKPPGSRVFVDGGSSSADPFVVKLLLAGQNTGDDCKVLFSSSSLTEANAYREWCDGGAQFHYEPKGY